MALQLLGAASAAAHANLVATVPAQAAILDTPPDSIAFTLDQPVRFVAGSVHLIDAANNQVPLGSPETSGDRTQLRVPVRGTLRDGTYLATVRAVSADTHVVAYSIRFVVGDADPGGLAVDTVEYGQAGGRWTTVIQAARVLGYLGAVLSFGLLIALTCTGRENIRDSAGTVRRFTATAVLGSALIVVGALVNLAAQGPYSQGVDDWSALPRLAGIGDTLSSPLGVRLLVRLVTAVLLGIWVLWRSAPWRPTAVPLLAGTVIGYTFAAGGHAAAGSDAAFAIVSTTAHVLAMAIWVGGVVALLLGGRRPVLRERWATVAVACLAVVLTTGVYQAVRRIYPLDSLWHTRYGLVLLAKVAGVTALVAAAFWAARWLRGRAGGRWAVRVELAAAVAVLVLTTVLASSVPARDDYGPALAVTAQLEQGGLDVRLDTTRRGPVVISLEPDDAARERLDALSATLSSEAAGIARLPVDLAEHDGVWTSANVIIPVPAEWTLSIVVDDGTSPVVTAVRYVVW
ncbi:copper resistance CopC/CopD family protein [Nocardia jinanensis]|uniref:copper resistance CopC/CopD family protein n=1 Tax=Nocardia jinanensis TaxID=382504 RepID=UPI0007A51123|nr:copper resistance protein CopC [Nocardia jinanensis]